MSARRIPWGALGFAATFIGMAGVGVAYHRSLTSGSGIPPPLTIREELLGAGDLVLSWTADRPAVIARDAHGEVWRSATDGAVVRVLDGDPFFVEVRDPDRWFAFGRSSGQVPWSVPAACRASVAARAGETLAIACGREISVMVGGQPRWRRLVEANVTELAVGEGAIAVVAGERAWTLDPATGVVLAENRNAHVIRNGDRAALVIDRQNGRDEHLRVETLERPSSHAELPADTTTFAGDAEGVITVGPGAVSQGNRRVPLAEPGALIWSGSGAAILFVRGARDCHARAVDLSERRVIDLGPVDCDPSRIVAAATSRTLVLGQRGGTAITVIERGSKVRAVHEVTGSSQEPLPFQALAIAGDTLWLATSAGVRCLDLPTLLVADSRALTPRITGCSAPVTSAPPPGLAGRDSSPPMPP